MQMYRSSSIIFYVGSIARSGQVNISLLQRYFVDSETSCFINQFYWLYLIEHGPFVTLSVTLYVPKEA
jgi:hypothetical protein